MSKKIIIWNIKSKNILIKKSTAISTAKNIKQNKYNVFKNLNIKVIGNTLKPINITFSSLIKNIDKFNYCLEAIPFYMNVQKEGVILNESKNI